MKSLGGHSALVTGGAQGIGYGIARELAKAGANVVIADIHQKNAEEAANQLIENGYTALAVPLDITDLNSIKQCIAHISDHFPSIDILVNNAGTMQRHLGDETSIEDFDRCYEVNSKAMWLVSQVFADYLKPLKRGKIINIASTGGRIGSAETPAYSASKAAAINVTQSLSLSLAPFDINVNAICPGLVWTPMWEHIETMASDSTCKERELFQQCVNATPLKRAITPEDIGQAVVFFASEGTRNITGQSLNINGGALMH